MTEEESETVFCTECGEEIDASASHCPGCGAKQSVEEAGGNGDGNPSGDGEESGLRYRMPGISSQNTTRRNALIGGGYAILGLGVLGAASDPESGSTNGGGGDTGSGDGGGSEYPDADAYHEDSGMVLYDISASVGEFSTDITGEAVNESGGDYEYVQLTFALYNESDDKVGDALANTNGLAAGQSWQFEAISTDSNASTYELNDVSAY